MAYSIDVSELREIFPSTLSDAALSLFIETGRGLVDDLLANSGHGDERMKQIALFVSAHLAHSADPRAISEDFSGYRYQVQGKTDMDWKATFYGQNALLLDTSGLLARSGKKKLTIQAYEPSE